MNQNIIDPSKGDCFSTRNLPPHERFDFWHDLICEKLIKVECSNGTKSADFDGNLICRSASEVKLLEVHCDPSTYRQNKRTISSQNDDYLLVSMRLKDGSTKSLNNKHTDIQVGDVSLYHATREQELKVDGSADSLILQIPMHRMNAIRANAEELNGLILRNDSPFGKIVQSYLINFATESSNFDNVSTDKIIDNFIQLLAVTFDEHKTSEKITSVDVKKALLLEIIEFIKLNAKNTNLTPCFIAQSRNISLRYLYNVFENNNLSPCQLIQEERLKCIANYLSKNRNARISETAISYGFSNFSHFSRVFKKKYGVSPKEYKLQPIVS